MITVMTAGKRWWPVFILAGIASIIVFYTESKEQRAKDRIAIINVATVNACVEEGNGTPEHTCRDSRTYSLTSISSTDESGRVTVWLRTGDGRAIRQIAQPDGNGGWQSWPNTNKWTSN